MPHFPDLLARLRGQLIVSVQADEGSPLRRPDVIALLALAAVQGGAAALRVRSAEDVRAVRAVCPLPIVGLTKTHREDSEVYITPTPQEARELAGAGCEIIAFDATGRPRPHPVGELVETIHAAGSLALADVSTFEEATHALENGADAVSTTLSGYTSYSPQQEVPDWDLMRALGRAGLPYLAEGRLRTPQDAARALELGALCAVVGTAITRPGEVTSWFVAALKTVHRTPP